jgi:hypothetical protein
MTCTDQQNKNSEEMRLKETVKNEGERQADEKTQSKKK